MTIRNDLTREIERVKEKWYEAKLADIQKLETALFKLLDQAMAQAALKAINENRIAVYPNWTGVVAEAVQKWFKENAGLFSPTTEEMEAARTAYRAAYARELMRYAARDAENQAREDYLKLIKPDFDQDPAKRLIRLDDE